MQGAAALLSARAGGAMLLAQQGQPGVRKLSTMVEKFTFGSAQDGPSAALGGSIAVSAKPGKAGGADVSVSAGGASAKASYPAAALRKAAATALVLQDVNRISTTHSSFMDYLLALTHERYSVLAAWPDFTAAYGKDYYYRAHPADLQKFYGLVDEFHRMFDIVTEFDSLSGLASQLVPSYRVRRQNTIHPAVGPAVADGAAIQFLLAHAK